MISLLLNIVPLHGVEFLLPFVDVVGDGVVHLDGLVAQLLVNFVQLEACFVHLNVAVLVQKHAVGDRGIVQASERDVSDLFHSEHARLIKSLGSEVFQIPRLLAFKFGEVRQHTVLRLFIMVLVVLVIASLEVEIFPSHQGLFSFLSMLSFFHFSSFVMGCDLALK